VNNHNGGRRRDDLARAAVAQARRWLSTMSPASHARRGRVC
jgi:hypothetical protein